MWCRRARPISGLRAARFSWKRAASCSGDAGKWQRLVKRLQPRCVGGGQGRAGAARRRGLLRLRELSPSRGAADAAPTAARNLRARLGEISQALGINLPVYVLFTQDRPPAVLHRVRAQPEQRRGDAGAGRDAAHGGPPQRGRLRRTGNRAADRRFRAALPLSGDARPEFLARERDAAKLPRHYEFPREFRKLRPAAGAVPGGPVPAQPVDRRAVPARILFLRRAAGDRQRGGAGGAAPAAAAGQGSGPPAPPAFSAGAHGSSRGASSRPAAAASSARAKCRSGCFSATCSTTCCWPTRSPWGPAAQHPDQFCAALAAHRRGVAVLPGAVVGLHDFVLQQPSAGRPGARRGRAGFRRPNRRRRTWLRSTPCASWRPCGSRSRRWSTTSAKVRPGATAGACTRATISIPKCGASTSTASSSCCSGRRRRTCWRTCATLPGQPAPDARIRPTYDALKAYLITTSNHDKSTRLFLAPVLMTWWTAAASVDPERQQLAQKQFDFYADELKEANPYSTENDSAGDRTGAALPEAVRRHRARLSFMLAEAGKTVRRSISTGSFPGSAQVVVDRTTCAGAFTKGGWAFMKNAFAASRPLLQRRAVGAGRSGHRQSSTAPTGTGFESALLRRFRGGVAHIHQGAVGGALCQPQGCRRS